MSDLASDKLIRVEFFWSPKLLKEIFWLNMTAFGSRARKRHRLTTALMIFVVVGLSILIIFPVQEIVPKNLLWFALGMIAMRALVTFFHIPAMNRRRIGHLMSSPLSVEPLVVKLTAKQVTIDQPMCFAAYKWSSISGVQEEPIASHLLVGEAISIPIPDDALPKGMTRAELLRRIEKWRGSVE